MTRPVYLEDAYRTELSTRVVACDGEIATLEETILYPEGGGQPSDRGTVGGVAVREVLREAGGAIRHVLERPVEPGEVVVELDWARRFDHMQQHTAQHLLSALAEDRLGIATMAFHLGAEDSTIEFDAPAIDPEAAARLEDLAAAEIRAARPVCSRIVEAEDLAGLRVSTRGLPEGHSGGIRLVEIEGVDRNTCGGTHVRSTAELEVVRISAVERIRGRVRVHYLAGGRVRAWARGAAERERRLTELLGAGPGEHAGKVERLLESARAAEKDRRRIEEELAGALASTLVAGEGRLIDVHRPESDPAFLEGLARAVLERDPERLVFLTGGPSSGPGSFLLAGPDDPVRTAGPIVAEALGGRGGGRGGRFQGKASRLEGRAGAVERLREALARS